MFELSVRCSVCQGENTFPCTEILDDCYRKLNCYQFARCAVCSYLVSVLRKNFCTDDIDCEAAKVRHALAGTRVGYPRACLLLWQMLVVKLCACMGDGIVILMAHAPEIAALADEVLPIREQLVNITAAGWTG